MIGVIEAHRDDLARRDGQIDLEIAKQYRAAFEFKAEPIRLLQDVNGITAHFSVEEFAVGNEAAKCAHGSPAFVRGKCESSRSVIPRSLKTQSVILGEVDDVSNQRRGEVGI